MKKIFEQILHPETVETEDGGCAKIATFGWSIDEPEDSETGILVRLQSWDKSKEHKDFKKFEGKRVKITIETIE